MKDETLYSVVKRGGSYYVLRQGKAEMGPFQTEQAAFERLKEKR